MSKTFFERLPTSIGCISTQVFEGVNKNYKNLTLMNYLKSKVLLASRRYSHLTIININIHYKLMTFIKVLLPSRERKINFSFLFIMFIALSAHGQDNIVFPSDAKILDVTKAPFHADKTGLKDATTAIQAALDSAGNSIQNIVYLPNGTYQVSGELRWAKRQTRDILQGQSMRGTIIKLNDKTPGYGDPNNTKTVIWTGQAPAQRFRNSIRNLTINTGIGNPGATAIQFIANNQGGMEDVLITSGDGEGLYGLDLGYTNEQGPCLIKGVHIIGFQTGIRTKNGVDGVVFENITLEHQKKYGLYNDGECISIENLHTIGAVPGLFNTGTGVVAIINSRFEGLSGASKEAAIINTNGLFARNISSSGFLKAIDNSGANTGKTTNKKKIREFVSHKVLSVFPSPNKSLNLPIKQTPEVPLADLSEWVNVRKYLPTDTLINGKIVQDWTHAIQKAIDDGKSTVYFPGDITYEFYGTIHVRGNVERIIGLESVVRGVNKLGGQFVIEDGRAPVVIIEKFDALYANWTIINRGKRTLVVKNVAADKIISEPGAGDIFAEDVVGGLFEIAAGTNGYARQLNLEGDEEFRALNKGGKLWILGIKTERDHVVARTMKGGKTEIIGGFIYTNQASDPNKIMFLNEDGSSFSATIGESVLRNQPFTPVKETRDGVTKYLKKEDAYRRASGSMLPLYTGYNDQKR